MVDRIVLNGIHVQARHGVSDEERSRAQEFQIDLACSTDACAAVASDDLSVTVDYSRLKEIAVEVASGGPYRLLETMAERIAAAIIDELGTAWLRVRVTKLRPPGVGLPASVEIERGAGVGRSAPVELHVPDFAPAKRFYGALGFTVAREESGDEDGYLVMVHGPDILRFWPGSPSALRRGHFAGDTGTPGHRVEIVLTFNDLDATFSRAASLATTVEPIRMRHWGLRDFRVLDPYGFYVRCTEPHDPLISRSRPSA